jgi:7-carboxy-7-deazaguanine synthase
LKVSEIFLSLQGEGRLAGVVSVFVRLAGCNLHCRWCDTAYARRGGQRGQKSVAEIVSQVAEHGCRHVVVTGGEPLIAPELPELLQALADGEKHVTLETNATQYRDLACDLVSISPKLAHSTPLPGPQGRYAEEHERHRLNVPAIASFIDRHDYQLKFVVNDESDLTEVDAILSQLPAVDREKVMLMPLARTKTEYQRRAPLVAALCVRHGFRFCPRLHMELWGRQRGK